MIRSRQTSKPVQRTPKFPFFFRRALINVFVLLVCAAPWPSVVLAGWGDLPDMHNYAEVFGPVQGKAAFKVTMLESNAPGNIFHPGQQPRFVFQVENLTDQPINARGRIDVIRYAQRGRAGDNWYPELVKLQQSQPLSMPTELEPRGWQNITIEPKTPETKGGYALVLDLGELGRRYLTSYVRTFKPELQRIQFPKQSLEEMPAPLLARLGVQAIRWSVSYHPTDSRRYAEQWAEIREELTSYHENKVTVVAEIGAGSAPQPLGRGRPHLDDDNMMKGGKQDLAWLPEYDDDYERFVYRLAGEFGWPKGPITGFMLWNEPSGAFPFPAGAQIWFAIASFTSEWVTRCSGLASRRAWTCSSAAAILRPTPSTSFFPTAATNSCHTSTSARSIIRVCLRLCCIRSGTAANTTKAVS